MFYKLKPNYIILINTVNKYFLLTILKHDFNTKDSKNGEKNYIFRCFLQISQTHLTIKNSSGVFYYFISSTFAIKLMATRKYNPPSFFRFPFIFSFRLLLCFYFCSKVILLGWPIVRPH